MKYSPNQLKALCYLRTFKGYRSLMDIGEFGLWTQNRASAKAWKALQVLKRDGLVERNDHGHYRATC